MKAFRCPGDYFIKPLVESPWNIIGDEDMPILSYEHNGTACNAIIVRQNGLPMVYRNKGYALVVAVECVKIAFILDESLEI
jgi:hypothetical protein